MFARKKRRQDRRIVVRDERGNVLLSADESDYVIPEAGVLRLSMEFFNDPEPCEIHRAAVRSRSLQHLRECCSVGETVPLSALDPLLRAVFPENAASVQILEDAL